MSVINDFLTQIEEKQIELHSCIIKKGEDYLYQQTALPYTLEQPQMLFSISKSFVSLAIGYLVEDKRLRLDEAVLKFFPEYFLKASDALRELKVIHLLTMTSGSTQEQAVFTQPNWIDAYFKQQFTHEPGHYFHYNNMDIYILSVIVTKITGISCNEYLYQKLFEPLGIEHPHWDTCALGYNTGGWGLYLSPRDLSRVAEAIIKKDPVLPLDYLLAMTTKKVTSAHHSSHDYDQGYGYLCWMNPQDTGARFDGIFGQLVLFSIEKECFIVITANCLNTAKLYPIVFDLWKKVLEEEVEKSDQAIPGSIEPMGIETNRIEQFLDANFSLRLAGVSLLPIPIRFLEKQSGHADQFKLVMDHHQLLLHWQEHYTTNIIRIGLDGRYRYSKLLLYEKQFNVSAIGWFPDPNTLMIRLVFLEYPYSRTLKLDLLSPKKIMIHFSENPTVEEVLDQYAYMLSFTPFVQINAWIVERSYHLIAPSAVALKRR